MAKTTIDGLRVREPSSDKRAREAARSASAHTIDLMRPAASAQKRTGQKASRREMLDSIDAIKRRNATGASEFLEPVETFDFGPSESAEFVEDTGADWSSLIDDLSQLEQDEPENFEIIEAPVRPSVDGMRARRLALPSGSKATGTAKRERTAGRTQATAGKARGSNEFLEAWEDGDSSDFLTTNAAGGEGEEPERAPRREKSYKRRQKKHRVGRIVAIAVVVLLAVGGVALYKWGDELIHRLTGGNSGLWDAIVSMVSDEVPFATDAKGRTNVLIFGTEGYNMNGETAYGAHDGAQLTDSIMVASFDQKTQDIALLSLPRDLKVSMACSAGKINEVFWCHNQDGSNEAAGAQALMKQVGDVLGVDFQYYVHINWSSLIDVIDALGGIVVTLDEDIADYEFTGAVAQAGVPMEINGEKALGLARARHGTQGGDFTRGNTQQKIVEAIVSKLMQNGVGVSEALNLIGILGDNFRSNFSTDNIKAGARLVAGFNIGNIRQVPLVDYDANIFYMTTATINEVSYVIPAAGEQEYDAIREYVTEMFSSNPTARERAKIAIYNASGQYGVAGAERTQLAALDYKVVTIGDAELGSCAQRYCVYRTSEDYPATAEALAERYGMMMDAEELPVGIDATGADFIVILGLSSDSV